MRLILHRELCFLLNFFGVFFFILFQFAWANWFVGADNTGNIEHCVHFYQANIDRRWNDIVCTSPQVFGYICKMESGKRMCASF